MGLDSILTGSEVAYYLQMTPPMGRLYFPEAVDLAAEQPSLLHNMSDSLIPLIAKNHAKSVQSVWRMMERTINSSWQSRPDLFSNLMCCELSASPKLSSILWGAYLLIHKNRSPLYADSAKLLEPFHVPVSRGYIALVELLVAYARDKDSYWKKPSSFYPFLPSCQGIPLNAVYATVSRFLRTCRKSGNPDYGNRWWPPTEMRLDVKTFVLQLLSGQPTNNHPVKSRSIKFQTVENVTAQFLYQLGLGIGNQGYMIMRQAIELCLGNPLCKQ